MVILGKSRIVELCVVFLQEESVPMYSLEQEQRFSVVEATLQEKCIHLLISPLHVEVKPVCCEYVKVRTQFFCYLWKSRTGHAY